MTTNLLFVCSQNKWRSPTAEAIWKNNPKFNVTSRGTSRQAVRTVTIKDINWADLIFVMETKHLRRIRSTYKKAVQYKPIHVLGIPDDYTFMDPDLVSILKQSVEPYLEA